MSPSLARPSLSIRTTVVLLVLAVLAPLVALRIYFLGQSFERETQAAELAALQRARQVAAQTAMFLNDTRTLLAALVKRPLIRALDPARCDPLFAEQATLLPRFTDTAAFDSTATAVCDALAPNAVPLLTIDHRYFLDEVFSTGKFSIGLPVRGTISKKWTIALAQPITDSHDRISGALALFIDLNQLFPTQGYVGLAPDMRQRIVNRQGTIIASSDHPQIWIGQTASTRVMTLLDSADEGTGQLLDSEGVDSLYGFARVPGYDWHVMVSVPRATALAGVFDEARRNVLLGLAALSLALLLAYLTARRLTRPVEHIASVAQRVASGDTAARAQTKGPREVADFTRDFNTMLDRMARQAAEREKLSRRYETLMDNAHDIILLLDPRGRIIDANETAVRAYGYARNELLRKELRDLRAPETLTDIDQRMQMAVAPGGAVFETLHRRRDGSRFPVEVSTRSLTLDGQTYLQSFVRDITERKQAQAHLQLAASVFTHAREGIIITDAQGYIVDINEAFTAMSGYTRNEVLGKRPRALHSGLQDQAFYAALWQQLKAQGYWSGEIWNQRKNGETCAEILTVSAVHDAQGQLCNYVGLFTEITSLKNHQQDLEYVAQHDMLTGLPNRLLQADRLHQAMVHCQRHGSSLALAYLDLDDFKSVNDRHGHDAGDALLVAVSKNMKDALREGDTLARIGGDEFVAVIVDLHQPEDCYPVLDRLMQAATQAVTLPAAAGADAAPVTLGVSASMGVTLYPLDKVDADQLLRHADQAMYAAKTAGKNRYHLFDVAQDNVLQSRHERIERLRLALLQREFVLHYQPKVNMASGQVTGAEALLRWQHPEQGLIAPMDFLPLIREQPIMAEIGEWVIDQALQQIETWAARGIFLPLSVNISALQLEKGDFPERLRTLLQARPKVPAASLYVEVLESHALRDVEKSAQVIQACNALGVRFVLDDFGTGYSSLTYLRRLPVETIKIDQTFVRDMLTDPGDMAIVKGVVGLAQAFGREVVAEGVETLAHGNALLAIGCEQGQGYGIARPMPADELPGWIEQWNASQLWTRWRVA